MPHFFFCTCNETAPLARRDLSRLWAGNGATVRVYDALCRGGLDDLDRLPVSGSGVFVGCGRQERVLRRALESAGWPPDRVLAWDVPRWIRGLGRADALRWAAAYARAAEAMLAGAGAPRRWPVRVGPRLAVAGPGTRPGAAAVAGEVELVWIGEGSPPPGAVALEGRIASVEGTLGAFSVEVATSSPVDPQRCVDCGACRAACPQAALGPGYRLDRERCDGCGRCEAACARIGALDLGRRTVTVRADQVLWAGGAVPARPGLYVPKSEEERGRAWVQALALALEGEAEAAESVRWASARCCHRHAGRVGCTRCLETCPTGALRSDAQGVVLDESRCSGCGACAAHCPTGALDSLPWGWRALAEGVRTLASGLPPGTRVAFVCGHSAGAPFAVEGWAPLPVPPSASFQTVHLLEALAAGAGAVAVVPCERCGFTPRDAFERAAQALARAGLEDRLSWGRPAPPGAPGAPIALPWEAPDGAAEDLRSALARVLAPLVAGSEGDSAPLAGPFGRPRVDPSRCTGCGACVGACRTQALHTRPEEPALFCTEVRCVGCGLCAQICPEGAVEVAPGLRWTGEAFVPRPVVRDEGWACPRCGKVFGTSRAVDTVIARLATRLPDLDVQLLRLCPDCRAVAALTER